MSDWPFGPRPAAAPRIALDTRAAELAAERERSFETGIPMRDGVELAADVLLPDVLPAPAVISGTPYDKDGVRFAYEHLRDAGYVVVVYDVRGRGKSEGDWRAMVHEGDDGHDAVQWCAGRDWCDGRVAMSGGSYSGYVVWATAATRPPALRCVVASAAGGRWMQEIPYRYGCFQLYFAWWAALVRRRLVEFPDPVALEAAMRLPLWEVGPALGLTGPTWRDMVEHDVMDDFWRTLRVEDRLAGAAIPALHIAGFNDFENLNGALHFFESTTRDAESARRQWLVVGPWNHAQTRVPGAECGGVHFGPDAVVDMEGLHRRFYDRWLLGTNNGAEQDPLVRMFDTGVHRWREDAVWPGRHATRRLYLAGDGTLTEAPPAAGATAYRYDPSDPVTTPQAPDGVVIDPPLDQPRNEERPDVLCFTGEPLERSITVRGRPMLELEATTDATDTEWHVRLTDVHPDGRSIRVAAGCLRAVHRTALERREPIEPGMPTSYTIELTPALHTFRPGHRVRLTITSSDFPWYAAARNDAGSIWEPGPSHIATNVIHHGGQRPSRLELPEAR